MTRRPTWSRVVSAAPALFAAAVLLVACGGSGSGQATRISTGAADVSPAGDIPDSQVFVPYRSPDGAYSLQTPEGWTRAQTGAVTLFTDKFNSLRVEATSVPSPPTIASATAQEVPPIAAATRGFKLGAVSVVSRPGGDAVRITYQADSATDAVTGKSVRLDVERYEFARNGQQVTIILSAPVGSDNVDPWKTITRSFGWAA